MNIKLTSLFKKDWFGLLIVVLISVVIIATVRPTFLSPFNLYVLMVSTSYMLIIALAQMIIIAIGQMNLSVGAIGGLVAISFSGLMEVYQIPVPMAVLMGLVIGVGCGFLNGYITVKSGISAFIITLATLYIFKGINLGVTEAEPFYNIPETVKNFGNARVGNTPIPFLIVIPIVITFLMWIFMNRTETGRHMLAYGNSIQSAELLGISSSKVVISAHVISGLLAAIAGMLVVCRLQLGTPNIGDSWLLPSFAAPVIGGAILAGGKVDVIATALGVLIVAIISQALVIFKIDPFFVQIFLGLMILLAVFVNRYREYKQEVSRKIFNIE